jgi:hypothetical protein
MGWPANTSSSKISHQQQQHSSEMGYQQLLAIVKITTQQLLGYLHLVQLVIVVL